MALLILTKTHYLNNRDLLKDDFNKILESNDPVEIGENLSDLFYRLPAFVSYRVKAIEKNKGESLD